MIPATAHFLWFGEELPWIHALAVRTAAWHGGFERVLLHHADPLASTRWYRELEATPRVEIKRLFPEELVESAKSVGPGLVDLYRRLSLPAARTNVLRAALLFREGGVYLDTDTVTVASLEPLRREASAFCGTERIAFPGALRWWHPIGYASALLRTSVRDLVRRQSDGWRLFRRIESYYPAAANNAVLGSAPGHPLLAELIGRMVKTPRARQLVRYELGTTLLQATLAEHRSDDVVVHEPEVFYPLGPELSEHWFRPTPAPRLGEVLGPATRVVHWYASVRTRHVVTEADPDYVRSHAPHQLFATLVLPWLGDL
jgi:hypothetical protein